MKETIKHSSVAIVGTLITGLLGAFFYLFVGKYLGPYYFGIFSIAVAAIALTADVCDIGTDTGIIHFVAKNVRTNYDKAISYLKLGLLVKLAMWMLILAVGWIVAPFVAKGIFGKEELLGPLRYALFGAGGALFFSFVIHALQAMGKVFAFSTLNIVANLGRLCVMFAFVALGALSVETGLFTYIVFPFLGFLVGLFILPKFLNSSGWKEVAKEFFSYNAWVAIFGMLAAVSARLDTFVVATFLPLASVGIYAVSVFLASAVPQMVFAIASVVGPKIASLPAAKDAFLFTKKLQLLVLVLAPLGVAFAIPVVKFIIDNFYGQAYYGSFLPFIVLLLAQAIFLIALPAHMAVMYHFSNPKLFVWTSLARIITIIVFGKFLVLGFGLMGAASLLLIGNLIDFIVPFVWAYSRFKVIKWCQ